MKRARTRSATPVTEMQSEMLLVELRKQVGQTQQQLYFSRLKTERPEEEITPQKTGVTFSFQPTRV
jgi:hypothetical protein